ncbi:MAG: hypothetical protein AAF809_16070 [Bacteroidota bacterium]
MYRLTLIVALAALALGCREAPITSVSMQPATVDTYIPIIRPTSAPAVPPSSDPAAREVYAAQMETLTDAAYDLDLLLRQTSTLDGIAAELEAGLAALADHPMVYHAEQVLAAKVLARSEATPAFVEDAALLAPHVERLVAYGHPDVSLIQPALQRLEGVWSAERVAETAARSHEAAAAWLVDNPCPGCSQDLDLPEGADAVRARTLIAMEEALPAMKALAETATSAD